MGKSRLEKAIKNAKISLLFYFLLLASTFVARSIFIKHLGADFVGLTSAMMNIMGFLNLAEMGFSSVIAFSLYKPIYEKNREGINEVLSVLAFIYNRIGWFVLICGAALAVSMPYFFKGSGFSNEIIWATFFTYLLTTLLGFFVNYKEALLAADQKNYVKVKFFNIVKITKIISQILCLTYVDYGVYGWLLLEFVFLCLYSLFINRQIKKIYPYLASSTKAGKALTKKYEFIYQKAKQAFFHKFSAVVLQQVSGILVYVFSNLTMVTKYTNYTLITSSIYTLLSSIFDSTNAAVGSLVAEKNNSKILKVYWELQVSRYWIATCMVYATYTTIDLFIAVWLNDSFILSYDIKAILMLNLFIMLTRKTNDEFISACGLFKDVWAPITEAVLNIAVATVAGQRYGIVGIPLGGFVSTLLIIGVWKPIFLFKEFMPEEIIYYFFRVFKYMAISLASIYLVEQIPLVFPECGNKYYDFLSLATQKTLTIFMVAGFCYFIFTVEMRRFMRRFLRIF
ncbi:lipopolysaccharide biosynthesis protein [Methylomonas albis]|uniref:Sugar transporter n=1 Tax=Methylomonas albis TaxID=1854563 RepID=A0ABR9D6I5_9GAMM|nr:sugar transporter [Methylomonas albis]MBD9358416.1 sugar transporter [Methylomonas albis]